jgi:HEAT repeat protein
MVWLESLRLCSNSVPLRLKAVEHLSEEQSPRALELLLKTLKDADGEVRRAATLAIGNIHSEQAVNALISVLADPYKEVRAAAVTALGRLGDRRAVGALLRCLRDPEARIRVFAATALNKLGWRKTTDATGVDTEKLPASDTTFLLAGMADPDPQVRRGAAEMLEKEGDPAHSGWFLPLLGNEQFELRLAAANYFGRLKDPHFALSIIPLLNDEDSDVREAAARTLGELKNPAAIDPLVMALIDEEAAVRQAAQAALQAMNPSWEKSDAVHKASARLKPFLNDHRPTVNSAAAKVLSQLNAARKNVMA